MNFFVLFYKFLVNDFIIFRNKNVCLIDRKEKRYIKRKFVEGVFMDIGV